MAALSDYTSGRISLANGSTTVTGTGTLFSVAKFREGDTLQIQNLTAVIASVNSDTSLTLTAPWTGTTLTNAVYRARYLPDGARVTAQATTLIELLGNGNLQSIAGLTGAADKGLMFTGAGTAGTFDLTALGRTILASSNGAAIWNAIGAARLLAANGWLRLPDGVIFQWGAFWTGSGDTITFPMTFPSGMRTISYGRGQTNLPADNLYQGVQFGNPTLTGIPVAGRNIGPGSVVKASITIYWFAMGY